MLLRSATPHQAAFLGALRDCGLAEIDSAWGGCIHHTDSWIFREVFRHNTGRVPDEAETQRFADRLHERFLAVTGGDGFDRVVSVGDGPSATTRHNCSKRPVLMRLSQGNGAPNSSSTASTIWICPSESQPGVSRTPPLRTSAWDPRTLRTAASTHGETKRHPRSWCTTRLVRLASNLPEPCARWQAGHQQWVYARGLRLSPRPEPTAARCC